MTLEQLSEWSGERLPFPDAQFDCVVTTLTLCSIRDPVPALREMRRVLKPDGTYVFLEHGRSDDARVARRQDFFNPLQRRLACGCNINRRRIADAKTDTDGIFPTSNHICKM